MTAALDLVLGVIPARGGSRGLARKHVRLLGGLPLIAHTIRAALGARRLTNLLVSTDDPVIRTVAIAHGAEVPFLRPPHLSTDGAPTAPVIAHAVEWFEREHRATVDMVVTLQPTSPLRTAMQIDAAIGLLDNKGVDSAVSVAPVGQPVSVLGLVEHDYWQPIGPSVDDARRQAAPQAMRLTGGIYVTRREVLGGGRLVGDTTAALMLDEAAAIDIDTIGDLRAARVLLRRSRR